MRKIFLLFFLVLSFRAFSQDSLHLDSGYLYPRWKLKEPMRAALLSAALPGLGQFYNRKLWYIEIPIIYGLGAVLGFTINDYHKQYIEFRDALIYTLDENDITIPNPKFAGYNTNRLREVRDRFRRDRDYYIILSAVAYLLNVAEAATMAHLKTFDVSDDLTARLEPFAQEQGRATVVGLSLKFYIEPRKRYVQKNNFVGRH